MDGDRSVDEIVAMLPEERRLGAIWLLSGLAAAGVVDVSGRPFARFMHLGSKRGVLPHGALDYAGVQRLTTDGNYRGYPAAPSVPVGGQVPVRLAPFHAITRARRSYRAFNGTAIARADFDALLNTACGVTGVLSWGGGEVKLRAYPSGGALYAVELYPVVFAVEGLEPAVYHFRAVENVLELVRPGIDRTPFLEAALPGEREMVAGVAVMFCLTGNFPRFECKYGEGAYRYLAAEAGHISQNLVLAATALGLQARPWGGVFDGLLNPLLGLETDLEQWLLSVIAGYADDCPSPA